MKQTVTINWHNPTDKLPRSSKLLVIFKVKDVNRFAFGYYNNYQRYSWDEITLDDSVNAEWGTDSIQIWAYADCLIK